KGRHAVTAHTRAIAGSTEVCDAALRAAGAVQVFSLDELIETAVAFSSLPRTLKAGGAAMVSLSGGEIALALDAAEAAGLPLPAVSTARETLTRLLPPHSHIANPLDLTWAGLYDASIARRCVQALAEEIDVGLVMLLQDAPRGLGPQQANRYATLLSAVADGAADAGVPAVAVSNLCSDVHPDYARTAAEKSVASLRGTSEGITAIAHLLRWARGPAAPRNLAGPAAAAEALERGAAGAKAAAALAAAGAGSVLDEHDAKAVLAAYGLAMLPEKLVAHAGDAQAAARGFAGPIVLKALVPGVAHKSEHGLVRLNIRSPEEAAEAACDLLGKARGLAGRADARLLMQPMVSAVAELLVGARVDPQFGPVIVAGTGGLNVELFNDVAIRLAPVSPEAALEMLEDTRAARLLGGWRGKPRGDLRAAAQMISSVSHLIAALEGKVSEIEINPLAVLPEGHGCAPLDCLIVRA